MDKTAIIYLVNITVFFIIHFGYTQKIISGSSLTPFLFFSLLFPVPTIIFGYMDVKADIIKIIASGLVFIIYYFLLVLVKKNYGRLNDWCIQKKLIPEKYAGKIFTFVSGGDGVVDEYWDETRAMAPSWADRIITFLLLVLPIILPALIFVTLDAILHSLFSVNI